MEKVIKLTMDLEKNIKISVNDSEKYIVKAQDRSISAEKIYEIMGFTMGDSYTVSSENEGNLDEPVLEFFVGLFQDITNKVNELGTGTTDKKPPNFSF